MSTDLLKYLVIIVTSVTFLGGCAILEDKNSVLKKMIIAGDCAGAEKYAKTTPSSEGEMFTALGVVHLSCYRNISKAREYFQLGLKYGNTVAAEGLKQIGDRK